MMSLCHLSMIHILYLLGMKFQDIRCCGCGVEGINGMVWKCLICFDYHLCTPCYMAGKHIAEHRFDCIITSDQKKVRVPPRCNARRVEIRGLFPGAVVTRGRDWHWGNQDGGVGQSGRISAVRGWSSETAVSCVFVISYIYAIISWLCACSFFTSREVWL